MENLRLVLEKVWTYKNKAEKIIIPERWNINHIANVSVGHGECEVNKIKFYETGLESVLNASPASFADEPTSLNMYSMLMRTFSAWKHDHTGTICNGTILKTICLLPLLKDMNIKCIYLLPVFETSEECKKGEIPSPYSIKNIMKIDRRLHDDIAGKLPVEIEFKAFIEACHRLGIRVIIDFVFRTAGRDCDLIKEHPESFYWIKESEESSFSAPSVDGLGHTVPDADSSPLLYESSEILNYISKFAFPPNSNDWTNVVKYSEKYNVGILEACRKVLSVVTVPGFADVINDVQPPWTDVTFFKLYNTPTPYAKKNLDLSDFPPFIAQDGVKASCFKGDDSEKNEFIWDYIKNVIPYYIENYHIDGARIDMAHALPAELSRLMLEKINDMDNNFMLWSEEFSTDNSAKVKKDGYRIMTGGIWDIWDKFRSNQFNQILADCLNSSVPVVSAIETPDTPRGRIFLDDDEFVSAIYLSYLLPNTVVSVNNGQELDEIQPMNLGLKNTEQGRFVLSPDNPMYGKLCFFDNYIFNWTTTSDTSSIIGHALSLRKRFSDFLSSDYLNIKILNEKSPFTKILCYNNSGGFLALFNRQKKKSNMSLSDFNEYFNTSKLKCIYSKNAETDGTEVKFNVNGFIIFDI